MVVAYYKAYSINIFVIAYLFNISFATAGPSFS